MRSRLFILITCSALISSAATAQRRGLGIFKFGINASFLNPDLSNSNTARFGLNVGLAPAIPLNRILYLKPEISYSMKGGVANYEQPFFTGSVKYRLNYFELPVVFGVRASKRVALEAGPYVAIRTGGNFDFKGTFFYGYGTFGAGDLSSVDYGVTGGLLFTGRFALLGIRYYHGLHTVNNTPGLDVFLNNATNHTIQIYFQRNPNREKRKRHGRATSLSFA